MQSLLRRSISPVVARLYRMKPISSWPKWAGRPARSQDTGKPGEQSGVVAGRRIHDQHHPGFARPNARRARGCCRMQCFQRTRLAAIALYLREGELSERLFGLDSFQGADSNVATDTALGGAADDEKRIGGFGATPLAHARAKVFARHGRSDPGIFCRKVGNSAGCSTSTTTRRGPDAILPSTSSWRTRRKDRSASPWTTARNSICKSTPDVQMQSDDSAARSCRMGRVSLDPSYRRTQLNRLIASDHP